MLQSWNCRRVWCQGWWGRLWMKTRRANHKSMWQRYGVWGLSPGIVAGSHTLPNHVTGNGQSTWHSGWVITLRPGALLEISFSLHDSNTPYYKLYVIICDWGRRYSQVRFLAVPDYVKQGSWCCLSRVRSWFGETPGGQEIGMRREWGGIGEGEVSIWATWDQGGWDRTTQEEGFHVSKRDSKGRRD
jgi:hypothetical protein